MRHAVLKRVTNASDCRTSLRLSVDSQGTKTKHLIKKHGLAWHLRQRQSVLFIDVTKDLQKYLLAA